MSHILISVYIIRPLTKTILGAMEKAGVKDYNIVAGRSPQIEEKSNQGGFLSLLFPGTGIVDEPVDVIQFLVSEDKEDAILKYLISEGQLMMSGRGSIYSENVEVPKAHNLCVVNQVQDVPAVDNVDMLEELSAVCCIVQRGQGQSIAQAALESGVGAPNVTFGVGTGVRDNMGLLRITIPANIELVWMANIRANYRGRFGYSDINGDNILDDDREYVNGYVLINAAISKLFKSGFEIQAGVENLLNHKDKDRLPNLPGITYLINCKINIKQLF